MCHLGHSRRADEREAKHRDESEFCHTNHGVHSTDTCASQDSSQPAASLGACGPRMCAMQIELSGQFSERPTPGQPQPRTNDIDRAVRSRCCLAYSKK